MIYSNDWAVVVPMANEAPDFDAFIAVLRPVLDRLGGGRVYFVVDNASKDNTRQLCDDLAARDDRFVTVWAPENRNVVDAYLRGFRAAYDAGHEIIIEMDGGLSHDPRALPQFLRVLSGTFLSNWLLGTKMDDMTSGFEGFHRNIIGLLLAYPLKSRAHFYQTEVRYLLRKHRYAEVPIHYRAPSNSVSKNAIRNARETLLYYFGQRLRGKAAAL